LLTSDQCIAFLIQLERAIQRENKGNTPEIKFGIGNEYQTGVGLLKNKKLSAKASAKRLDTNQPMYTRLDKINTTHAQQVYLSGS
jgi:hypothetical protein